MTHTFFEAVLSTSVEAVLHALSDACTLIAGSCVTASHLWSMHLALVNIIILMHLALDLGWVCTGVLLSCPKSVHANVHIDCPTAHTGCLPMLTGCLPMLQTA